MNTPPNAELGVQETKWHTSTSDKFVVNPGSTITFDAGDSWDSYNGNDLNYTWVIEKKKYANGTVYDWIRGTNYTNISYPNTTVNTTFDSSETGRSFIVMLTVWDTDDELPRLNGTATATVYVTNSCNITLSADPTEIDANGGISNLTANLTTGGSPISGVTITFSGGLGIINPTTSTTTAAGETTSIFTSGSTIGQAEVMAATPGSPTTQPWFYAASDSKYYNYDNATTNITTQPSGQITLS